MKRQLLFLLCLVGSFCGLQIYAQIPERAEDISPLLIGQTIPDPVPSVFVVDTSGKIMFEYINPDFRTRLSAGLLIAVLRELKNSDS